MKATLKKTLLAALLTGACLPATIVCDVPNVDIVVSESVPEDAPAVSRWGLSVLVLLLLTAGAVLFRRRVALANVN